MSIQTVFRHLTLVGLLAQGLMVSCTHAPEPSPQVHHAPKSAPPSPLDGTWLQTGYFDSIYLRRAIVPFALRDINQGTYLIRISGTKIETQGLLFGPERWTKPIVMDAKDQNTFYTSEYRITYLADRDLLQLTHQKQQWMDEENEMVTYRRMGEGIWRDIFTEPDLFVRENKIEAVMRDSLLAGTYRALSSHNIGKQLVLDKNGHLHGHRRFTHYAFDAGFGTIHPYCGRDGLSFYDSLALTIPEDPPGPPIGKTARFAWAWEGDTLVLTEMKTDNWETYYPGKTTYRYLRVGDAWPPKSNRAGN